MVSWEEEKRIHSELVGRRDALAELEREEARKAVHAALSGYRWWHPSNLANMFRIWLQGLR